MANDIAPVTTAAHDAIGVEVFANLFKAVVDEMAWVVLRSSHTTFVKETQDFGVALVTPEGEQFAYPYGSGATPLMGVAMDSVTQAMDWEEGDVVITNDPYATRGTVMHLNDIYVYRPVFVDGQAVVLRLGLYPLHRCRRLCARQHRHAEQRGVPGGAAAAAGEAVPARRAERRCLEHLRRQLPHPVPELGRHDRLRRGADQGRDCGCAGSPSATAATTSSARCTRPWTAPRP